jgi:hypothetical protein
VGGSHRIRVQIVQVVQKVQTVEDHEPGESAEIGEVNWCSSGVIRLKRIIPVFEYPNNQKSETFREGELASRLCPHCRRA